LRELCECDTPSPMTLDTTHLLATVATVYGVAGALSILLQARHMRARRASGDVSLRFLVTYVGGYAIWLLYGLSLESVPIAFVNGVGLAAGAVTLAVAVRLRCAGVHRPAVRCA
jgi:uncharacterized protein with PQ loop repeat